jgi:hypothetical protein
LGEIGISEGNFHSALPKSKGKLDGIGQATASRGLQDDSIDHEFKAFGSGWGIRHIDNAVFLANSEEALFFQPSRVRSMDGGKQDGGGSDPCLQNLIHDLLGREGDEGVSGFWVIHGPVNCKKDTEVVMNFGRRCEC